VRAAAGPATAVGAWADAVERAAFGEEVVDEARKTEVDRIAPPD
jgi:hypothetical protein